MASLAEIADVALGDLPTLSKAATARAKKLLSTLHGKDPNAMDAGSDEAFREAWIMGVLALQSNPRNEEAKAMLQMMQAAGMNDHAAHGPTNHDKCDHEKPAVAVNATHPHALDVVVVGAGCSGVGVGFALTQVFGLAADRVLLVDRGAGVGETFRRWPKEMRFISPSFNQQGWTESFDLNSIAYNTSPAFMLHAEHPTGDQYASYLEFVAQFAGLNVRPRTDVTAVRPLADGFEVAAVTDGVAATLTARYVIWAAGEFQAPRGGADAPLFPGSELCRHNSTVRSWADLEGDDFVVVGGYESGMDAASNLATTGKSCTVVSSTAYWNVTTADPSAELAPFTGERLRVAARTKTPPRLLAPLKVTAVERDADEGGFVVKATWGPVVEHENCALRAPMTKPIDWRPKNGGEISLRTPQAPVLCAGFVGSVAEGPVRDLFAWGAADDDVVLEAGAEAEDLVIEEVAAEDAPDAKGSAGGGCAEGAPLLDEYDQSTKTPGLFLVGPAVRHGKLSFCFVYKFRQRFSIVADAIARGLGKDTTDAVAQCRKTNMFLDDFECCQGSCQEGC